MELPFEVYCKIFSFLSPEDQLNVAALNETLREIFVNQRKLNFSECYNISNEILTATIGSFRPDRLVSLNLNHCHWIQGNVLKSAVKQLISLQDLHILDIGLDFQDINEMVNNLPSLSGLSVSILQNSTNFLSEDDYQSFQLVERKMRHCFPKLDRNWGAWTKLEQLKVHLFDFNYPYLLAVLSWCENCTDLSLVLEHCSARTTASSYMEYCRVIMDSMSERLRWLAKITKFVYVASLRAFVELTIYRTLVRLIRDSSNSIERLWTSSPYLGRSFDDPEILPLSVKSYVATDSRLPMNYELLESVEMLAGVARVNCSLEEMNKLKLFHGSFRNQECFTAFCNSHPNLEVLCLANTSNSGPLDLEALRNLRKLTVLALSPSLLSPDWGPENLLRCVKDCPWLEEFHLISFSMDRSDTGSVDPSTLSYIADNANKLKRITLSGLTQLSNQDTLPQSLARCHKLESLEIVEGDNSVLGNFYKCLPQLSRLTDLRLREVQLTGEDLVQLLQTLPLCINLRKCALTSFRKFQPLLDYLKSFPQNLEEQVTSLGKLVSLYLVIAALDSELCAESSAVLEKVSRKRPQFWYLIANRPVHGNDGSIPFASYNSLVVSRDYQWVLPSPFA